MFVPSICSAAPWLQVLNEAYAACKVEGEAYDAFGCSYATSFGKAFADACARATADAHASINNTACDCDLSYYLDASAWSAEYADLFAKVAQKVEAYACTGWDGISEQSEIRRECTVNSIAYMFAQVRAPCCSSAASLAVVQRFAWSLVHSHCV